MEYEVKPEIIDVLTEPKSADAPVVIVEEPVPAPIAATVEQTITRAIDTIASEAAATMEDIVESEAFNHWMEDVRTPLMPKQPEVREEDESVVYDLQPDAAFDSGDLDDRPASSDEDYFFPAAKPRRASEEDEPDDDGEPPPDDDEKPPCETDEKAEISPAAQRR